MGVHALSRRGPTGPAANRDWPGLDHTGQTIYTFSATQRAARGQRSTRNYATGGLYVSRHPRPAILQGSSLSVGRCSPPDATLRWPGNEQRTARCSQSLLEASDGAQGKSQPKPIGNLSAGARPTRGSNDPLLHTAWQNHHADKPSDGFFAEPLLSRDWQVSPSSNTHHRGASQTNIKIQAWRPALLSWQREQASDRHIASPGICYNTRWHPHAPR